MVYANGSPRTKARAGLIARPASLAVGAARRTRIVLILLVALLRLSAPLPPSGRRVLHESLGRRKQRRRSNGAQEKRVNERYVGKERAQAAHFQRRWYDQERGQSVPTKKPWFKA